MPQNLPPKVAAVIDGVEAARLKAKAVGTEGPDATNTNDLADALDCLRESIRQLPVRADRVGQLRQIIKKLRIWIQRKPDRPTPPDCAGQMVYSTDPGLYGSNPSKEGDGKGAQGNSPVLGDWEPVDDPRRLVSIVRPYPMIVPGDKWGQLGRIKFPDWGDVIEDLRTLGIEAASSPGPERADGQQAGIAKHTLAKAILFEDPEISPTELAKRVGVRRGTLYKKSPQWIDVRRTLIARGDGHHNTSSDE